MTAPRMIPDGASRLSAKLNLHHMDDTTQKSLQEIIDRLYADELKRWMEAGAPESGHLFNDIARVTEWLGVNGNPQRQ